MLINLFVNAIRDDDTIKFQNITILFYSFFYFLLFSTRDITVGADTENYINNFHTLSLYGLDSIHFKDYGFYFYLYVLDNLGFTVNNILYGISFMFVFPIVVSFLQFNSKHKLMVFFAFVSFFFFESMAINVMRQGIAAALFLLTMVLYLNNKRRLIVPLLVLSFTFHASVIIPILVFIFTTKIKKIKIPVITFFLVSILSYINYNTSFIFREIPLLNILFESRLETYYEIDSSRYRTGFRWDFYLFNLFFLIIGLFFFKMKDIDVYFPKYKHIYISYIFLTSYFVLMFNVPFSDRFGVYSWILIPFILAPLASKKYSLFRFYGIELYLLAILLYLVFEFRELI